MVRSKLLTNMVVQIVIQAIGYAALDTVQKFFLPVMFEPIGQVLLIFQMQPFNCCRSRGYGRGARALRDTQTVQHFPQVLERFMYFSTTGKKM